MTDYRFNRFKLSLLMEDMRFLRGPKPGEPFPEFELPTTDGGTVRKADFTGKRPLLLTFASIT